jgi:hypothetical protein
MPQFITRHAAPAIRIGSSVLFIASIAAVMGSLPVPQAPTVATATPVDTSEGRMMIGMEPMCIAEMPGVPLSLCFMPGTSAEEVNKVTQSLVSQWAKDLSERPMVGEGDGGAAYFATTRWIVSGSSAQGTPLTLTWSMPADGLSIPDGITGGAASPNNLNATFVTKFGSLEAGKSLLRQVYARWSDLSGVNYTEVTDDNAAWGASGGATRGAIRIVGRTFGSTGVLAYNYFPNNGDMVIVTSNSSAWTATNNQRYFRNILAHEHGHGLGFDHVCPANNSKLMEPFLTTAFDGPQNDDIRAAQRQYGDNYEPNDTIATGSAIINESGTTTLANLSIDDNADVDYYKFNANVGATVTVRATPQGPSSYLNGPQNANGSCSAGTTVLPLAVQDLVVSLYRGSSTTPLIVQNAYGPGTVETITSFPITSSDVYSIRVSSAITTDDVQLYSLVTTIVATAPRIGDFDGNGVVNGGDLGILLAVWGPVTCGSQYDLNGDCVINGADLGAFLADWG